MHLHDLTIKKLNSGLLNKEFSALEVTREYFDRIKEKDEEIGAYLTLSEEDALSQASKVDVAVAGGEELPLLAGVPLVVKDNILIEGGVTTAASKILEGYKGAYDATVIEKLKKNQAVFLGKANLDEFAMGASTENSAFKKTKNPHDLTRVPGGSSGGSASAVAANMAFAALGSDTNGSIRQPASFCGVVGLKPTYGAVSRHGLIALGSSLDQIGPVTKTVEDAAIIFEAIAGTDEFDSTSVRSSFKHEEHSLDEIRKLKIGLPKEYFVEGIDRAVRDGVEEVINKFKNLKIKFEEISLPHTKYATSAYYIILPAEASTNLARYDGVRYARASSVSRDSNLKEIYFKNKGSGFGSEPKRRILLGTFVLSAGYYDAYYTKAQKVRRLIKQDFDEAFKKVDVILTPTAPTPAFKLGEKANDPLAMYLADVFTSPSSLSGLPAISIPVKKYVPGSGELPVGFQLIGRYFHEADILGIGRLYEKI
jgi:aspartyl-tRNA(Asn)/glutamyl-tRNA(Gln) amidotransferase subunit A